MAANIRNNASEAANRYAAALFELASDNAELPAVAGNLANLQDALASSEDLSRLTNSPAFSREEKVKALVAVAEAAGFTKTVSGFIGTMAQNGRASDLPGALQVFDDLYADHRGVQRALATTAKEMSADQRAKLEAILTKAIGSDVELETDVNPAIVGGIQLRIGSKLIDASIATKLDRMNTAMKGA